jgi:hypothetical protein
MAASSEIAARGLTVGNQIAVTGFDDTDASQVSGLTSLAPPLEDVAAHCARLITALLDTPGRPPEHILLPPALMLRASSSRAMTSTGTSYRSPWPQWHPGMPSEPKSPPHENTNPTSPANSEQPSGSERRNQALSPHGADQSRPSQRQDMPCP